MTDEPLLAMDTVAGVVHDGLGPAEAYELFRELSHTPLEGVR